MFMILTFLMILMLTFFFKKTLHFTFLSGANIGNVSIDNLLRKMF